jgi:hypothetical protein
LIFHPRTPVAICIEIVEELRLLLRREACFTLFINKQPNFLVDVSSELRHASTASPRNENVGSCNAAAVRESDSWQLERFRYQIAALIEEVTRTQGATAVSALGFSEEVWRDNTTIQQHITQSSPVVPRLLLFAVENIRALDVAPLELGERTIHSFRYRGVCCTIQALVHINHYIQIGQVINATEFRQTALAIINKLQNCLAHSCLDTAAVHSAAEILDAELSLAEVADKGGQL